MTDQLPNSQPPSDEEAGFEVSDKFRPFSQKNDVFSRSFWDKRIRSNKTELFYETYRKPLNRWRRAEGFTQKDYALRNAAWHVTDLLAELKEAEDRREGFLDEFSLQRPGPAEKVVELPFEEFQFFFPARIHIESQLPCHPEVKPGARRRFFESMYPQSNRSRFLDRFG